MMLFILLAAALGFATGLRSFIAPTAVAWAAYLGWIHLDGSEFHLMASPITVALLSFCALGELIADKLPFIPSRITPAPLGFRLLAGAFAGACLAVSTGMLASMGAVAGAGGAVAGAFAGYHARKYLVQTRHAPALLIALSEDAIALGLALFVLTR